MRVIIAGGGIGGLTTALMLHAFGIKAEIYEQAPEIRELGVGINTLPQAIDELAKIGLLEELDKVAIRTNELYYLNRLGQEVWHERRGMAAGHLVPQFSIHRGRLQNVLLQAVLARIGDASVHTGQRLVGFEQNPSGVEASFQQADGTMTSVAGDVLVGADGIHSFVRSQLVKDEGPPKWSGLMMWRGAVDWPVFLDGQSMVVAGGLESKVVAYPIAEGLTPGTRLTNWGVISRTGPVNSQPPRREDWSRPGSWEDLGPRIAGFKVAQVDINALIRSTPNLLEWPMCDRDPLPQWSFGNVTLLGDSAHPMYPVGSNGASQAILDARALADCLASGKAPRDALFDYDQLRRPPTSEIVLNNRLGGPEGVIDAIDALAPGGFSDVDAVLPRTEREAIVRGRAGAAAVRW
jgi:2-polyprenyl-6-methoxyphenol hydroxylase-like FAD-dependent oxidoreductase